MKLILIGLILILAVIFIGYLIKKNETMTPLIPYWILILGVILISCLISIASSSQYSPLGTLIGSGLVAAACIISITFLLTKEIK